MSRSRALFILCVATACATRGSVQQQGPAAAEQAATRSITLERPRCYGECPVYNVTLSDNGSVRYQGIANVAVKAVREWRVPADSAARVFRFADSIGFAGLPQRYEFGVAGCVPYIADNAAFAITLLDGDQARRVYADEGCPNVPSALKMLRGLIDRTSGVEGGLYLRP